MFPAITEVIFSLKTGPLFRILMSHSSYFLSKNELRVMPAPTES